MKIYAIECNGKVSQEAYTTFDNAQKFLKSRIVGRDAKLSYNGWRADFEDGGKNNVYKIIELNVAA